MGLQRVGDDWATTAPRAAPPAQGFSFAKLQACPGGQTGMRQSTNTVKSARLLEHGEERKLVS